MKEDRDYIAISLKLHNEHCSATSRSWRPENNTCTTSFKTVNFQRQHSIIMLNRMRLASSEDWTPFWVRPYGVCRTHVSNLHVRQQIGTTRSPHEWIVKSSSQKQLHITEYHHNVLCRTALAGMSPWPNSHTHNGRHYLQNMQSASGLLCKLHTPIAAVIKDLLHPQARDLSDQPLKLPFLKQVVEPLKYNCTLSCVNRNLGGPV